MSNRLSNSLKRRLEILNRTVVHDGVLVNAKWCFALVQEPAMKQLLKRGLVKLERHGHAGGRTNRTIAKITPSGLKYRSQYDQV